MKNAILRLAGIIVASVGVVALLLFSINQLGRGQTYSPLDHSLMNTEPLVILDYQPESGAAQSLASINKASDQCPKCLIKLDIRLSLDDVPYVFAEEELEKFTTGEGYFSLQPAREIDKLKFKDGSGKIPRLQQIAELHKKNGLYLVVHTRDASKSKYVLEALSELSASEAVVVASPFRQTLKDIRTERPRWLYTTPPAYLMRIQIMHSLFIENMADIWPDILVTTPEEGSSPVPSGVLDEFQKRYKRIVVQTEAPTTFQAWKNKVHNAGLLTTKLQLALEVIGSRVDEDTNGRKN